MATRPTRCVVLAHALPVEEERGEEAWRCWRGGSVAERRTVGWRRGRMLEGGLRRIGVEKVAGASSAATAKNRGREEPGADAKETTRHVEAQR
jgi:hypothetical protein